MLVVCREVHHCVAEHVLGDVGRNFDLGVADDEIVDVVVGDYQLLPVFLAVDFVNVDVVIIVAVWVQSFRLFFTSPNRTVSLLPGLSHHLGVLLITSFRAILGRVFQNLAVFGVF